MHSVLKPVAGWKTVIPARIALNFKHFFKAKYICMKFVSFQRAVHVKAQFHLTVHFHVVCKVRAHLLFDVEGV